MTSTQIVFWMVLTAAAILPAVAGMILWAISCLPRMGWARYGSEFIGNRYGVVAGELLGNNNARAAAGLLLAILLTISAFIGGRGEPLLQERWDKVKESVGKFEAFEEAKNFFWQATGDGEVVLKLDPPKAALAKEDDGKPTGPRPSWWNWIAVLVAWPLAFAYLLWSFHDEVGRAVSRVWQRRRATLHAEDNPTPADSGTAPAPAPQATNNRNNGRRGNWSFSLDLLTDVLGEIAGEIFSKIMSRGVVR